MQREEISKDTIHEEALAAVRPHQRSGAAVSMGVGKTLIALKHMQENYNETSMFLVVAPKHVVFDGYKEEAQKWGYTHLLDHIVFSTYISLPEQGIDYDVVYLDECHSLLYSHDEWLSSYTGKVLGLTGTPPKFKNSEKGKMVDKHCPIAYTYIVDEAVSDGLLNDYIIYVHKLYLSSSKSLLMTNKKGGSWYTSEKANYEYWTSRIENASSKKEEQIASIMRMKALMDFPTKETYAAKLLSHINSKCILFANTKKQADKLCSHSYHSDNPDSADNLIKFKSGKITKLSAVLQLSESVNIPNLKSGIIMHAYGNERKSPQRLARLLRLNPDEIATAHILCYMNTVDEKWVARALSDLDQSKINWIDSIWVKPVW